MSSLGETVAALARRRRGVSPPLQGGPGRLSEVQGFGSNPGALRMLVYAPERLQARAPLVVVLHGCGQSAEAYAEGAGWLTLADRLGLAVLCPEQTRANNANVCFNWFEPADVGREGGEAASIHQMVQHAIAAHGLDESRVFVTGLSAGGAMTAAMLAAYPETFAAGAVIAGLAYGAASNVQEAFGAMYQGRSRAGPDWGDRVRGASRHSGAWPRISIWHGDGDGTVRPGASDDLVRQWTDVHGLAEASGTAGTARDHAHRVWRDADGKARVELHRIAGMGHGAPLKTSGDDGSGAAGPYLLEVGISSSLEIARFWGLLDGSASAPAIEAAGSEARPSLPRLMAAPRIEPAQVISRALRSAGLLK